MRFNFATRLGLILCGVTALAVAAMGTAAYLDGRSTILGALTAELYARAIEKQSNVDTWAEGLLAEIGNLAASPGLVKLADALQREPGNPEPRLDLQRELTERTSSDEDLAALALVDTRSGALLAGSPDSHRLGPVHGEVIANGKAGPWIGDVGPIDQQAGERTIVAAVPVQASGGTAVLAALIRADFLVKIAHRRSGLRQTDDSYLLNEMGDAMVAPLLPDAADRPAVAPASTEAARRCLRHNDGLVFDSDVLGRPAVSVYRCLPRMRWCLVVSVSRAEALPTSLSMAGVSCFSACSPLPAP